MRLTRRNLASSLVLSAGLAAGGVARASSPDRPSGGEMKERFHRYVERFNSGRPEELAPFFAPEVVLYLPGRKLVGPDAIVGHYRHSFGYLSEWLRIDALIADEYGLAAELYTRFTAHRDYPGFTAHPLETGDVYVVTTFVFYEFGADGRFKRIRPAMWQRDLSGVTSLAE